MLSFYAQFLLLQKSYFLNYDEILFTYIMYFPFLVLTIINDMFYTNWFATPTKSFNVIHTFFCRFPIVHPSPPSPSPNAHSYTEKMLTFALYYLLCEHNFCDPTQYHSQNSHKSVSLDYASADTSLHLQWSTFQTAYIYLNYSIFLPA